jgi:hypothetical protein
MATTKSTQGAPAPSSAQLHTKDEHNASAPPADTFRIIIRRADARWGANLILSVAQNVGGFILGRGTAIERPGYLKSEPEAQIEYEKWPAQVGDGVSEFQVVMTLDRCSDAWGTFDRVVEAAQKMADNLGAACLNADGEALAGERLLQEKARVDRVLEARRASRNAHFDLPDGTRATHGLTSFHVERRTRRGKWFSTDYFDVPPLEYYAGQIHGYRCMLELLDALRDRTSGQDSHCQVERMIEAAARTADADFSSPSKGNVASGFIDILARAVFFFAQHANYRGSIEQLISSSEKTKVFFDEREAKERAEFVERMRKAREAKAAQRK